MERRDIRLTDDIVVGILSEEGHPDGDRPTIVLVHGIGMGAQYFAGLADELRGVGRVLSIELPGFGESPTPDRGRDMRATGEILAWALRADGVRDACLVGHSMGTQVVVEAALADPGIASRLVLIAPTVNRHERTMTRQALRMAQDLVGESPRVIATGIRYYLKTSPRWFVEKLRSMLRHPVEERVPGLRQPTLVLRGGRDRVCPEGWVREVTALIADARMQIIPDVGHETMIADPTPTARAIARHLEGRTP